MLQNCTSEMVFEVLCVVVKLRCTVASGLDSAHLSSKQQPLIHDILMW